MTETFRQRIERERAERFDSMKLRCCSCHRGTVEFEDFQPEDPSVGIHVEGIYAFCKRCKQFTFYEASGEVWSEPSADKPSKAIGTWEGIPLG